MEEIENLDKWLKHELTSRGISAKKLAKKSGVSDQTIYNICHGEHKTNLMAWMLVVEGLGYRIRLEKEDL